MMGKNIKNVDESIRQKIIQDYKNCKSIRQIERDYGVTRYSVAKYLEEQEIKTTKGNHHRKYIHQFDYFKVIDSEEKAYWLGFMFADGYIVDYSNRYGEDKFGITFPDESLKQANMNSVIAIKKVVTLLLECKYKSFIYVE